MSNAPDIKIILLAEDDTDDRELFCEALLDNDTSRTIHCTENGREAIDKLQQLSSLPDMIFLDINMPVMNGWQCLKVLKEDDRYKNIPVVVYSSSSHQREKDIATDMGAANFFTKPDNFYEFKEKLSMLVNS